MEEIVLEGGKTVEAARCDYMGAHFDRVPSDGQLHEGLDHVLVSIPNTGNYDYSGRLSLFHNITVYERKNGKLGKAHEPNDKFLYGHENPREDSFTFTVFEAIKEPYTGYRSTYDTRILKGFPYVIYGNKVYKHEDSNVYRFHCFERGRVNRFLVPQLARELCPLCNSKNVEIFCLAGEISHGFCRDCIKTWVNGLNHDTCPICTQKHVTYDLSFL